MNLIIAMISPDKLEAVQAAVRPLDAAAAYVSTVGDLEQVCVGSYRGSNFSTPLARLRLEVVVVNERLLQETVDAIAMAATIDERGNRGSLFVVPLQAWIHRPGNDAGVASELEGRSYAAAAR